MIGAERYRQRGAMEGRCLCGAVTIRINGGYIAAIGACHCSMCQRWTGALYATFDADADAVQVIGAVTRYPSTHFSERAFCPTCGSNLWLRDTNTSDAPYELMPGLFRAAAEFPLISEIYIDRRPSYLPLVGDHPTQTRSDYEAAQHHVKGDEP